MWNIKNSNISAYDVNCFFYINLPASRTRLNMPALGTSIETVPQFLPIFIILPLLYTHISLTYNRRYIIVTTESVVK
jgi:hypothetical protein